MNVTQWTCPECGFGPVPVTEFPVYCVCKAMPASEWEPEPPRDWKDDLPEESRQLLIGDRVKQLTDALGIPQCGGCANRQAWLNKAHQWVLSRFSAQA